MAGTRAGGKAAAATNKAKYGADFYAKIGANGGKKGHTGGFFANRKLARIAGARGGRKSRRVALTPGQREDLWGAQPFCKNGHLWAQYAYIYPSSLNRRQCLACQNLRYQKRKLEQAIRRGK